MKSKNKEKMLTSSGTACINFYDCDQGKICKNGVCSACQTNSDCPTNMECNDYDANGFMSCYAMILCNGQDLKAGDVCCNYKACSGECIKDAASNTTKCCLRESIYHQTVNGKTTDYCCDTSNGYTITDNKTKCCPSGYLSQDQLTCLYCDTTADCSTGQTCSGNKCSTSDDPCEGKCLTDQECIGSECCNQSSVYHQTVNGKTTDYCCDTSNGYTVTDNETKCCPSGYLSEDQLTCLYCKEDADCSFAENCSNNKCTDACKGECTSPSVCANRYGVCCPFGINSDNKCSYDCASDDEDSCRHCPVDKFYNNPNNPSSYGCCANNSVSLGACCSDDACNGQCCTSGETCINQFCCPSGYLSEDKLTCLYCKEDADCSAEGHCVSNKCCSSPYITNTNKTQNCCDNGNAPNDYTCCQGDICNSPICMSDDKIWVSTKDGCCNRSNVYDNNTQCCQGEVYNNNTQCCQGKVYNNQESCCNGTLTNNETVCCNPNEVFNDGTGDKCCNGSKLTDYNGANYTKCCPDEKYLSADGSKCLYCDNKTPCSAGEECKDSKCTEPCGGGCSSGQACINNQCCSSPYFTDTNKTTKGCCNGNVLNDYTCCDESTCNSPMCNSADKIWVNMQDGCCNRSEVYNKNTQCCQGELYNNGQSCCENKDNLCYNADKGQEECCVDTQTCTINGCGGTDSGNCTKTSCPPQEACAWNGCCSLNKKPGDPSEKGGYCNGTCCEGYQACVYSTKGNGGKVGMVCCSDGHKYEYAGKWYCDNF